MRERPMGSLSQAARVRHQLSRPPLKVVAITSGKGGVGKTTIAANIAVALAAQQQNTLLLDADLSLANVDVLLGLQPRFNLAHVISGETDLDSAILRGPAGVRVIPASSGNVSMIDLPMKSQASIVQAFSGLADQPDILLVDTAAGLSDSVARFVQAAQEAVVVVCDEPSSITDAYALIKILSRHYGVTHFQIVTNQSTNLVDGRDLFNKIRRVADMYLDVVLRHLGDVPADLMLKQAVQEQRAVVHAYPRSSSAQALTQIARKFSNAPATRHSTGGIEFFFERLLGGGEYSQEVNA